MFWVVAESVKAFEKSVAPVESVKTATAVPSLALMLVTCRLVVVTRAVRTDVSQ
jgi:hypothetical protein